MLALTDREREIANLMADGHTNHVIAVKLGVSKKTLATHRHNIYSRLRIHSASQLVRLVLEDRHAKTGEGTGGTRVDTTATGIDMEASKQT